MAIWVKVLLSETEELIGVELQSVHAPPGVHQKYREVASRLIEREMLRIEEEASRIERLTEARIIAAEELQKAKSEEARSIALSTATAEAFRSLAKVDRASGGVVQLLMNLDAQRRTYESDGSFQPSRYFALSPYIQIRNRPFSTNSEDASPLDIGPDAMGNRPLGGGNR